MFGGSRRRRPPTTPLNSATANPNATTAAASAYMSATSHNPNKALSSAAAAAALRARPHTPTNVAEVQTKRTLRRSASMSSTGSGPVGAGLLNRHNRPERPGSSASMTERTFRSPSPHRPSAPTAREQQPPVPQIPDSHKITATTKSNPMGVGMQNFYTASEKMKNEHPSWYVGPAGDTSNVRRSDSIMGTTNSPRSIADSQLARSDSRNSVNFSYPTAFRPQSPPSSVASPSLSRVTVSLPQPEGLILNSNIRSSSYPRSRATELVYDPNSRRMVPKFPIERFIEPQMKSIVEKPSRRRESGSRSGRRQSVKESALVSKTAIVDEDQDQYSLYKQQQPVIESLPTTHEMPLQEQSAGEVAVPTENSDKSIKPPRSSEPSVPELETQPASLQKPVIELGSSPQPSLAHKPPTTTQDRSVVDETANMADLRRPSLTVLEALDAIPTRQVLLNGSRPQWPQSEQELNGNETAENFRALSSIDRPESLTTSRSQRLTIVENRPVVELVAETGITRRSSSYSPARQARFAPRPAESLAVRHVPLPRSASPIKSAMKHTSSTLQEASPPDNWSDPPDQKETTTSRKKAARVSFDDHGTVIVGEPNPVSEGESSVAQSPQGFKRAWFSHLGRGRKKAYILDDDEIMKPRPALPSFGSIREKKIRELGERPLVRPPEPACSSIVPSPPTQRPHSSSTLNDSETTEESSLGQSSDHAVGASSIQDQTSRNAANISRFREPLPSVVNSIESSRNSSENLQGSDCQDQRNNVAVSESSTISSILNTPTTALDVNNRNTSTAIDIPQSGQAALETIATNQPGISKTSFSDSSSTASDKAPRIGDSTTSLRFDVPGSFPSWGADCGHDSQLTVVEDGSTGYASSSSAAIFKHGAADAEQYQENMSLQAGPGVTTPVTDDESEESIYSDAYEDIPDFDSGVFVSLNAIVQGTTNEERKADGSQISDNLSMPATSSQPKSDIGLEGISSNQAQSTPTIDRNDWEQAKAFWRSLTAEKRQQLELEAAEEAGADGDREDVSKPVRRNSAKKQFPEQTHPSLGNPSKAESRVQISIKDEEIRRPASPQPRIGIRKTLRPNAEAQSAVVPSTQRLSSHGQATKPRAQPSTLSTTRSQPVTQVKPNSQRRESDTSDSSFKRNRPPISSTVAFRKTMRRTSPIQPRSGTARGSSRFSLRSPSPIEPTNTLPGGMKLTLRPTRESSVDGKRSSIHFPLFSRSMKSAKDSKWSSRFEDSSGEDEGPVTSFQSRIRDSSDEEDKRPMSAGDARLQRKGTLRGSITVPSLSRPAPVPELHEESPELPSSDDGLMPSPLRTPGRRVTSDIFTGRPGLGWANSGAIGTSTLGRSRSGRGDLTHSFTTPVLPVPERRGSLLGRLRRNKKADDLGKIQHLELIDSAARRDITLEQDAGQLKDLRNEQTFGPKLQKRLSMSHKNSRESERPTSSQHHFNRSLTADAIGSPKFGHSLDYGVESRIEGPGPLKKKKFGALRRMFKLDD
ncbi:hypothetical protein GGS21DRAFT_506724 [Xylaria nigripes]|nr:hypothetical protein GGS21DRAFT_506724 [Xylaria nigripes]